MIATINSKWEASGCVLEADGEIIADLRYEDDGEVNNKRIARSLNLLPVLIDGLRQIRDQSHDTEVITLASALLMQAGAATTTGATI